MIRTHYFSAEQAERILMKAMVEELVKEGWDREGIKIVAVDPFGDGINGYMAEQGTTEAQLLGALANEENR